ncbi:hypothetical protein ACFQVC_31605 [Streptomyces monticola]|uniref:DUF4203 domain-containing protein n=1 Tax=Streptomyces monticola TaxID=2666263 RepID=A0ABW2JSY9_9ACTN
MSQPWQPASQPQQPQPPQPASGNPYAQSSPDAGAGAPPPMPPQPPAGPPGPPPGAPGVPPQQGFPGQAPPQQPFPGQPAPAPGMQPQPYPYQVPQSGGGSPVGAFFLGLLVSFVISLIYGGLMFATYKDQSESTATTLYLVHAVINGAAVGAVAGLVGRRSSGAHISAGIVAALGAFFGYTNALMMVQMDIAGSDVYYLLRERPFFPAEAWWHIGDGPLALLGLVLGGAAGWGLAKLIGSRR